MRGRGIAPPGLGGPGFVSAAASAMPWRLLRTSRSPSRAGRGGSRPGIPLVQHGYGL